ncbi:hypothetical protein CLF_105163 [Clonorchis sinensis]|uniref:Uncharacterized protein n=1 Tax=Clonorchis sinensis TaxID=79923 RepID=G7YD38_CLOSI|nr:hypothetical protein CLF_105163 [Clonorchis sinensis]
MLAEGAVKAEGQDADVAGRNPASTHYLDNQFNARRNVHLGPLMRKRHVNRLRPTACPISKAEGHLQDPNLPLKTVDLQSSAPRATASYVLSETDPSPRRTDGARRFVETFYFNPRQQSYVERPKEGNQEDQIPDRNPRNPELTDFMPVSTPDCMPPTSWNKHYYHPKIHRNLNRRSASIQTNQPFNQLRNSLDL